MNLELKTKNLQILYLNFENEFKNFLQLFQHFHGRLINGQHFFMNKRRKQLQK